MTAQLDLFRDNDAADAARAEKQRRRDAHRDSFQRAEWVAPWDCADGMRKGETLLGWVCPECSKVEPNEYLLHINHGYCPGVPDIDPVVAPCQRRVVR